MDFKHYCRGCGHHISFASDVLPHYLKVGYCPVCDKTIVYSDTIEGYRLETRTTQLKLMNVLMRETNDEEIYDAWICTMPDCPTQEDYKNIAMDDKAYNECFDVFVRLIADDGNRW